MLAALGGFATVAAFVTLWWPLGFDQSLFALNGATVLRGGIPYVDAWETRGPLSFYVFAGIEAVFGRSALAVRLFDLLALAAINIVMWRAVRRRASTTAATTTVALWTLSFVSFTFSDTAQLDLWTGYAMLACALLVTRRSGYLTRDLLLAALAVGFASLLKPFYAAFLLVPGIAVAIRRRDDRTALVRELAVLGVSWAMPIALALAALAVSGGWQAFIEVHIRYNARIYTQLGGNGLGTRARALLEYLWRQPGIALVLPGLATGFGALWRRERTTTVVLGTVVMVGLACIAIQGRFWPYHWETILPTAALLVALGLGRTFEEAASARTRTPRALAVASVVVIAMQAAILPAKYVADWLTYISGRHTAAEYYGDFGRHALVRPAEDIALAAFIAANTPSDAPLGVWGADAAIAYLADRPSVDRFPQTLWLTMAPDAEVTRALRREYLAAIEQRRPPYYVVADTIVLMGAQRPALAQDFPELADHLARYYVLTCRIGEFTVHRRATYGRAVSAPCPQLR